MSIKSIVKKILTYIFSIINRNRRSKVLYYHDVHDKQTYTDMGTHISMFERHVSTIQNAGFEIVSHITSDKNQVMICFDDGFRGIWDCKQFFIDNNIKPTVFIAVELIGREGYLTLNEIKELHNLGFIFGCHTWSHVNLTTLNETALYHEISESKYELEKKLEFPINDICFPMGYFDDFVYKIALESNYNLLYSSLSGDYNRRFKENLICRYLVQHSTPSDVRRILMGGADIFYKWNLKHHYRN